MDNYGTFLDWCKWHTMYPQEAEMWRTEHLDTWVFMFISKLHGEDAMLKAYKEYNLAPNKIEWIANKLDELPGREYWVNLGNGLYRRRLGKEYLDIILSNTIPAGENGEAGTTPASVELTEQQERAAVKLIEEFLEERRRYRGYTEEYQFETHLPEDVR